MQRIDLRAPHQGFSSLKAYSLAAKTRIAKLLGDNIFQLVLTEMPLITRELQSTMYKGIVSHLVHTDQDIAEYSLRDVKLPIDKGSHYV
jgi:hypothetical protein